MRHVASVQEEEPRLHQEQDPASSPTARECSSVPSRVVAQTVSAPEDRPAPPAQPHRVEERQQRRPPRRVLPIQSTARRHPELSHREERHEVGVDVPRVVVLEEPLGLQQVDHLVAHHRSLPHREPVHHGDDHERPDEEGGDCPARRRPAKPIAARVFPFRRTEQPEEERPPHQGRRHAPEDRDVARLHPVDERECRRHHARVASISSGTRTK